MMMRMKHTVLVTGSSRGIGAGIARRFAKEGHRVAIHYREREDLARALLEELSGEGCSVMLVSGDLTVPADVAKIVKSVRETFGFVDVLVNNAGVALPTQLITDTSLADWNRVLETNVTSMFLLTNAVLPEMISERSGAIVNISSMWGVTGGSCEVAYSASKAAVIGYTKALAKEVAPSGVRVNCIAPGFVLTDMTREFPQETIDAICEETPLLRAGTPEDIAGVALFLASEDAAFITGQVLSVDGGRCI
jgi:3-oxoacyl-[acyl-carrier protein] reductase